MRTYDAAFYVAALFILGIAGASLGINVWLTLIFAAILVVLICKKFTTARSLWLGILLISTFAGYFYFNWYVVLRKEEIIFDKEIVFDGTVIEEPRLGLREQELTLKIAEPYKGEVTVYTDIYPEYAYGDFLNISGEINKSASGRLNIVGFPCIELIESMP